MSQTRRPALLDLSPREWRSLKAGITGIALILLMGRGVPAWRSWRATAVESALHVQAESSRMASVLARLPESLDSLEARTGRLTRVGPALFIADSRAGAAARATSLIAEFGRLSSASLGPLEAVVDTTGGASVQRVVVNGAGMSDIAGIGGFLARIEGGPTLLTLRRLEVEAANPASPSSEREVLSFEISVEGLALIRPTRSQGADGES